MKERVNSPATASREELVRRRAAAAVAHPALALQHAAGNRAVSRLVQRRIPPGKPPGTAVVKHLPASDESGWSVVSFRKFKGDYNVIKDKVQGFAKPEDLEWGLEAEKDASRKDYLASQASVAFDYSTLVSAGDFPRSDFRYWFYYMLQQVDDKDQKLAFVQEAFKPTANREINDSLSDDAKKKELLTRMFKIGFVSFENLGVEMKKELVKKGAELSPKTAIPGTTFAFGFRGDSRDTDILKSDGGFSTKTESKKDDFRKSNALDEPWNPFSDPKSLPGQNATGNAAFFRRSDTDNDLTTAVSVAKNFFVASKFPMLEEKWVPIEDIDYKGEKRKRKKMFVYLLIIETGIDTAGAQGKTGEFPELATISVPWTNHAAVFDIERIHLGPTANDGHILSVTNTRLGKPAQDKFQGSEAWKGVENAAKQYSKIKEHHYDPTKD